MTGHVVQMAGQMQAQAEAQRMDAKQREEAQRAEAMKREELALAREQMLAKMKTEADDATRKREQLFMEHELKRQKVLVEANTTLQQEKIKADKSREIAHLEAMERREAEFQQLQEKERERAKDAQVKLRELAAQELKERVHLERELVKQQQQNLILQKQREIDRLEAQADINLFQQEQASSGRPASKEKLAPVQEEPATLSPEIAVMWTDSDTPPPSQNKPKPVRRPPVMVDVGMQASLVSASELPASSVVSVSEGPMLGLATGVPLPTSHGPLVLPRGPVAAATSQPLVNPYVGQAVYTAGTQPVGSLVSSKPLGDSVPHLPTGLATYPAYAQQCLAPPLVPSSVLSAPTASLFAGPVSTCVTSTPPTIAVASMPSTVAGADTRSTYVCLGVPLTSALAIVDTKAVPLASAVTTVGAPPPTTQVPIIGSSGQTSGMVGPVAVPPAPTVVIKQPEPVRPYTGTTSSKAYKEYLERICVCNEWKSQTECARHLLVAMDGAASEAVTGLKAEKDSDLALIWEALSRRFGFVDEPERAVGRLDAPPQ